MRSFSATSYISETNSPHPRTTRFAQVRGRPNPLPKGRGNVEEENILKQFSHEPGIREVQEAAIDYAEVHPDKIKKWREAATRKALLPDVSLCMDRYVTDLYHWDTGQNPDVLQTGDDVITWDVTMSWDLGDLVWSTDQTSIDTRSRLMVQLCLSCVHGLSL